MDKDFIFGAQIDRQAYKPKMQKWVKKGLRHVIYFYNFATPSISLVWVKLEKSNLVCGLIANPTNQKMQKNVKRVSRRSRDVGHAPFDLPLNFLVCRPSGQSAHQI